MILRQARRRNGFLATAGRALRDPAYADKCVIALTGEIAGASRGQYIGAGIDRGPSGYLSYADSPALAYTDGQNFMAECFVFADAYPSATSAIFTKGGNPGNHPNWSVYLQPSGALTVIIGADSWYAAMAFDTGALPVKKWQHLRLTVIGNSARLFVEGVLWGSASGTGARTDAQPLTIGGGGGTVTFPGQIDGVRVCRDGAASLYDITAFAAPTSAPGWREDVVFYASSGLGRTVVLSTDNAIGNRANQLGKLITLRGNARVSTTRAAYGRRALYLGAGGYATAPHHADFSYTDGQNLSAEAEVYLEAAPANWVNVLTKGGVPGDQVNWELKIGSNLAVNGLVGASSWYVAYEVSSAAGAVPLGQWVRLKLTITANTMRLFVNGTLVASVSGSGAEPDTQPFTIGPNNGLIFPGYIDAVNVVKNTVPTTASHARPTTAPAPANDSLLIMNFEADADIGLQEGMRWSKIGTVYSSDAEKRFYGSALRFENGCLQYPSHPAFSLTGDWTIKTWVYWEGGNRGLWGRRNSGQGVGHGAYIDSTGLVRLAGVYGGTWYDPLVSGPTLVALNTWTPVAFCRRSNRLSIVVGTTESAPVILPGEPVEQDLPFAVGSVSSYGEYAMLGWMQDFVFLRASETAAQLFQTVDYRSRIRRPPGITTSLR